MVDLQPIPNEEFARVIRHAPLVSLDLIIKDPDNRVLVGLRSNEPARGYFFIPGGIVRKNEAIADAFRRILHTEIGYCASITDAEFRGVFEHRYETNRFHDPSYGTHYIVLAYELKLAHKPTVVPDLQHTELQWLSVAELLSSARVHVYTKCYFQTANRGP
jgi:colanic acid biosynthesis protein WcaH